MSDFPARVHDLRHLLATIAYRATRAIEKMPPSFGEMEVGSGVRTPRQIVGHMADLMELSRAYAAGEKRPSRDTDLAEPTWEGEMDRFFAALAAFDGLLASRQTLEIEIDPLLQGPVADALTHVGQLAMMRRMAGHAIPGESYLMAEIIVGKVGPEQAQPRRPMG